MRILLTGGTGYIASHTAVVLIEAGHNVVLYDNLSNSHKSVIDNLQSITNTLVPFIQGDVLNTELLTESLVQNKIDAVIHFAGLKAVGESIIKPIEYYDNNIGGTLSLINSMQAANISTLVFSSSATVYGNPQYLPLNEGHPVSTCNPYGRSKLYIEEILKDLVRSAQPIGANEQAWSIANLRYFNPVGAHKSSLIGENPTGIPNNLMPYIAQVAVGRLPHLKIFGNDFNTHDGTGVRDYIHVMDLAEGHLAILNYLKLQHDDKNELCTYNLGTGVGCSVLDMVQAFERVSGKSIPCKYIGRRNGDVDACYAEAVKAKEDFGWKATRTLDEMCLSTWRFQNTLTNGFPE